MHDEAKGKGRVFPKLPPPSALARKLRDYLKLAEVERDIFETDATRRKIDWYGGTRGTGITWCAVRGDEPLRIMQRAGHEHFDTTLIYICEAENLSAGFGEPFPALPTDLLQPPGGSDPVSIRTKPRWPIRPRTRGSGWAQQDLKRRLGMANCREFLRKPANTAERTAPPMVLAVTRPVPGLISLAR